MSVSVGVRIRVPTCVCAWAFTCACMRAHENKQETKFFIFLWNHDITKPMISFHWSLHEQHSLPQNV